MKKIVVKNSTGISDYEYDKVYDEVTETFTDEVKEDIKKIHLCANNCANCYADKCAKVEDVDFKSIEEYDFINSGVQVVDENKTVGRFIVSDCDNYKYTEKKQITKEDRRKARRLRESLRLYFFDVASIDESYKIQSDLINRGELKDVNAKKFVRK